MSDNACKALADHFDDRRAKGLVDIKFYVHNASDSTVDNGCEEAAEIFRAIDAGAVEPFSFDDRHPA